jgi:hypothetical protein
MGKNILLVLFVGWLNTCGLTQVLQGIGKKVEEGAKNKSNEFNSTRSNKEKSPEQRRKTNSLSAPPPAPASAPVPAPAESESPAPVEAPAAVDQEVQETYVFSHKITYHIESWNPDMQHEAKGTAAGKLKDYETSSYYADDAVLMMDDESNTILDYANKFMITLNEQEKTAMVLSLDGSDANGQTETEKPADQPEVVKSGRQKMILGNTCDEYLVKEKDGAVTELWVASRITAYPKSLSGYAEMIGGQEEDSRSNGLMLEMISRNKMGAEKMHMLMTEYKEEAYQVDLSDYKVTNE